MAVSTTNAYSGPYTANGATTVFPFTFSAPSEGEVSVLLIDGGGVQTEVASDAYAVTLTDGGGGSVTFTSPPASGNSVVVLLDPDFTQEIEFENGSAWLAEPVNEANDRAAARDQALKRDLARTLSVPFGEAGYVLDRKADRAGVKLLGTDADGDFVLHNPTLLAPGSPGGNVMSVGLFTAIPSLTIPAGTDVIFTSGHDDIGVNANFYVRDPDQTTGSGASAIRIKAADNVWWRLLNRGDLKIGNRDAYIVAGVIRYVDDTDNWQIIDLHPSKNVASISYNAEVGGGRVYGYEIHVNFDTTLWGPGPYETCMFLAGVDEDFSTAGISVGTGGYDNYGAIRLYKQGRSAYIHYDGSAWQVSDTLNFSTPVWNATTDRLEVSLTQPYLTQSAQDFPTLQAVGTNTQMATADFVAHSNTFSVMFWTPDGTRLTDADTTMAFTVQVPGNTLLNPLTQIEAGSNSNVWFIGIQVGPEP